MKKILITILIVLIIGIGSLYFYNIPDIDKNDLEPENNLQEMNLRIEFIPEEGIESQEIRVLNDDDEIIFQLTIDELNQWTKENWDIFEETPEVGGREVDPTGFGFFDRAASISPDNRKMIFSVSDYATLTTTAFHIVVDISSGEMNMIDEPTPGSAEDYSWSEDSNLIAYTVGTARARGDFLLVDDTINFKRNFRLEERDILSVLDPDEELIEVGQFMPVFEDLEWSENRLYFTTSHPENNQVEWSVNKDGGDLKREDFEVYESSSLNISLKYPSSANINYEEGRLKVTYVGEESRMTEIIDGFTFFVDVQEGEIENVAEEEFEKRTQMNDPITSPYQTEINNKEVISFEIEGGLGGEHVFFLFEENDKVIITSQFIADPYNNNYEQKVRDILLSIELREN